MEATANTQHQTTETLFDLDTCDTFESWIDNNLNQYSGREDLIRLLRHRLKNKRTVPIATEDQVLEAFPLLEDKNLSYGSFTRAHHGGNKPIIILTLYDKYDLPLGRHTLRLEDGRRTLDFLVHKVQAATTRNLSPTN